MVRSVIVISLISLAVLSCGVKRPVQLTSDSLNLAVD